MKHFFRLLFFLLTLPALAQQPAKPGEYILMVSPGSLDEQALRSVIRPLSAQTGAYLVSAEPLLLRELETLPGFLSLQPNYYLSTRSVTPNDPFFTEQWSLERIQAPDAWSFTTGGQTATGETIVIAVIDDGFDLDHPDLSENIWINPAEANGLPGEDDDMNGYPDDISGWNFDIESPVLPIRPHGTSVLGVLGARGNNDKGIAGINWDIQIVPITSRTVGDLIEAYTYVFELRKKYNATNGAEGAFVVAASASLGFNKVFCAEFPSLEAILDSLGREGVLSVAATANGNWDVDQLGDIPTSCASDYLISVTNADRDDEKITEAAFGSLSIDLAAPGAGPLDGVYTTTAPGDYDESFGGTSAACPHVSGAVALLYAIPSLEFAEMAREKPAETALLVKQAILEGVDSLPAFQDITTSGGRLNLFKSALYLHGVFQPIAIPDPGQYADRRRVIRVFPNPVVSGEPIQIVYGSRELEPVTLRLYNALGQLVQQTDATPLPFEDQILQLPTLNLLPGAYWIVLENGISPLTVKVLVF